MTTTSTGALWLAYASLKGRQGNVAESRNLFAQGLQVAPHHTPLLQAWASLELRVGNFSSARTLITQALTRDKYNGSGWLVAAEIERRARNFGLVQLILRRGIECCCSRSKKTRHLNHHQSPTTTRSLISMATTTHEGAELYRSLGNALLREGKITLAREIYERGIEWDPRHAPLYHSLAELEAQVFNVEGLSKLHKRAAKFFTADFKDRPKLLDESLSKQFSKYSERTRPGNDYVHRRKKEGSGSNSLSGFGGRKTSFSVSRPVVALAQRIVEEDDDEEGDNDYFEWLETSSSRNNAGRGEDDARPSDTNRGSRTKRGIRDEPVDPDSFLESMMNENMLNGGLVGDILQDELYERRSERGNTKS